MHTLLFAAQSWPAHDTNKNPLHKEGVTDGSFPAGRLNGSHNVPCLEALGTFQQVELDHLALVQRAIPVLLNSGEVNEHIFAGRPLDEAKTLGTVEPVHCTLLSHRPLLSPLC